jgi:hypothetical protein
MQRRSVVLPQPLWPMMPTTSPARAWKEMSCSVSSLL